MNLYAYFIFLISIFVGKSLCLYFYLTEGSEKCFTEIVPHHIPISVTYNKVDIIGIRCLIVFKDPSDVEVYSRVVNDTYNKGIAAYMTQSSGEYTICVRCDTSNWFNKESLKWELSIDIGDIMDSLNTTIIANKNQFEVTKVSIKSLIGRLDVLLGESEYEYLQQQELLKKSLEANSRITNFSLMLIITTLISTIYSTIYLKKYFHKQRLF